MWAMGASGDWRCDWPRPANTLCVYVMQGQDRDRADQKAATVIVRGGHGYEHEQTTGDDTLPGRRGIAPHAGGYPGALRFVADPGGM